MRAWVGMVALLVGACRVTAPDDGNGSGATADDRDGDGVTDLKDCDPDNADVYPGATDGCDGIDNDCDDSVDEDVDVTSWFRDQDGDEFGDPDQILVQCAQPNAYVALGTDCGPSDASIFPGAPEHCDGLDHDCDGVVMEADAIDLYPWFPDVDGDGFGDATGLISACEAPAGFVGNPDDCDDTRDDVSPHAAEVCDDADVDEDCDGLADERDTWWAGGSDFYPDFDHDGFGDAESAPAWRCDAPFGYAANSADCADEVRGIHPGADERCNGYDDNCDDVVDDDAIDRAVWYADADVDGYGDAARSVEACEAPSGFVDVLDDCNDHNDTVHPGATESDCDGVTDYNCDGSFGEADADTDGWSACEECNDADASVSPDALEVCNGVDDNCDGSTDGADAVGVSVYYVDADGDGYGDAGNTRLACAVSPGIVTDASDCDDSDAAVNPAAVEDCATADDDDCDGTTDASWAYNCIAWFEDVDADGYGVRSDCLCGPNATFSVPDGGDCDDSTDAVSPGVAERCENGVDDDCDGIDGSCTLDGATATIEGVDIGDLAGTALAAVGDVNGDGFDDIMLGSPGSAYSGVRSGAAYIVAGPIGGAVDLSVATAFLYGEFGGDAAGTTVVGGADLDSDGLSDVMVGAPDADGFDRNSGTAILVLGPLSGSTNLGAADATIYGVTGYDHIGSAIAFGCDMDGDGRLEVLLGAPGSDGGGTEAGAIYLFESRLTGFTPADAAAATVSGDAGQRFGSSVLADADLDGDGADDAVIGAPRADGDMPDAGSAFVFLGPLGGSLTTGDADGQWLGETVGDTAGTILALAGDVDGDGLGDILVGAPSADNAAANAGAAYIVFGPALGVSSLAMSDVVIVGGSADDALGSGLAGAIDRDVDGVLDVIVGAPGQDENGADAGQTYVFFGGVAGVLTPADAGVSWPGVAAGDAFGTTVCTPGDLDGDGFGDIVSAAPNALDSTAVASGVAYLL